MKASNVSNNINRYLFPNFRVFSLHSCAHVSMFLVRLLLPLMSLCLVSTIYLYLYPAFHLCQFPAPSHGQVAPFRLLAFGDPQLEGDTSLPFAPNSEIPDIQILVKYLRDRDLQSLARDIHGAVKFSVDYLWYQVQYARKHVDLLGNDYYLAHIFRTLHWWLYPTHITVLGDLVGSQWIKDEEFERRSWRYWNRVFAGAQKVSDAKLNPNETGQYSIKSEILGADHEWRNRVINIPGNHDIGYAGDVNEDRIVRFEREFGPINGDIIFTLPRNDTEDAKSAQTPSIRLILLNTMTLDGPAYSYDLQLSTIDFVNAAMTHAAHVESHDTALILLTHIPLHKEPGVCVDEPLFTYYDEDHGGGIKEQNFLSPHTSKDAILQGVFGMHSSIEAAARGMGRDGLILTGHDHEGCDIYHFVDRTNGAWHAQRWLNTSTPALVSNEDQPGVREVTVRSMMGEFGGNAALVAAWWDEERERWFIEVSNCRLGVQHVWWAIHVLDFVTFVFSFLTLLTYVVAKFWEGLRSWTGKKDRKTQKSDNRAKTAVRRRLPVVRKKNLKP